MTIDNERHGWSVRNLLAGIVVAVVVVFVGVGLMLGRQAWRSAQNDARAEAAYLAAFGAGELAVTTDGALAQARSLAANTAAVSLLADPTPCSLDFELTLSPESHLDLVRASGTIACSSADLPAGGLTHAGARWLASPSEGVSEPFADAVTGKPSIALIAPIRDQGRVVGAVAVVVPTAGIAGVLADTYGGPRHYDFALVDTAGTMLLSSSQQSGRDSAGTATGADALPGSISSSALVKGTTWAVVAGGNAKTVLGPTRSNLFRGGVLGGCVLLVLMACMLFVNRRIGRPIRQLSDAVAGTETRLGTALAAVHGPVEIEQLARKFQAVIADRDAYELQLSHQALHDPLTGLANRALLAERLGDALERSARLEGLVAVLFIDLDRFKMINDSLGHDIGDMVLIEVARRIGDFIPPGGTLARFGGDEFVVVVEMDDDRHVEELVEQLLAEIAAPISTHSIAVRVTASIGVATSGQGFGAVALIRDADNAMYAAKDTGRDRAHRFTSNLHDRAAERLTLATEVRFALDRDQLHLVYQPKIDLVSGEIVGVEALLRWDHPTLGTVPPATFIPIAEETDTILRVGEFVLEEACRQAMQWRAAGIQLSVAVNVSGRQLTDGGLPLLVATALAMSGLPAEWLCLELTETLLMTDTLVTQRSIEELHALGVRLSIDDFGTGYSSLAYLHRFPVHELKIDRSFISDLTNPAHPASLVSAMIAMGKALGLDIVAEGVETTAQAAQLRALGCDKAQGYLYARPQSPDNIAALVSTVPIPT